MQVIYVGGDLRKASQVWESETGRGRKPIQGVAVSR